MPAAPHDKITGNWLSLTNTLNIQEDVFPEPSVAVQVTVVVPRLKTTPDKLDPVPVVAPVRT
ncbi:hypothetical protein D3C80_1289900 [compost metagenome]